MESINQISSVSQSIMKVNSLPSTKKSYYLQGQLVPSLKSLSFLIELINGTIELLVN